MGAAPIRYQLLEVPVETLELIGRADLQTVGKRKGRQSLGADVYRENAPIFHVHFDGSDGNCQVRNLRVEDCALLLGWDWLVTD